MKAISVVDAQHAGKLYDIHNDLTFLTERLKIVKVVKLVAKMHCKTEYVIQIRNLEQALNHELVLKKVAYRVIKFMQKALIKSDEYWLRQSGKNDFLN